MNGPSKGKRARLIDRLLLIRFRILMKLTERCIYLLVLNCMDE